MCLYFLNFSLVRKCVCYVKYNNNNKNNNNNNDNKRWLIENPYSFLATRFVHNYAHYQSISVKNFYKKTLL